MGKRKRVGRRSRCHDMEKPGLANNLLQMPTSLETSVIALLREQRFLISHNSPQALSLTRVLHPGEKKRARLSF